VLLRLSGADPEILRKFRAERGIYTGTTTAILSTGAIAGLAMWFAMRTALDVSLVPAIVLAVAWALFIIQLDRWLVVSLKRHEKWQWWKYFAWGSPRLALALLFGIIISTPITLQIFNSEISFQLTRMHGTALAAFDKGPVVGELEARIASDLDKVNSLTMQSAAGTSVPRPASDPQIQSLEQQLKTAQTREQADLNTWQCQLYGSVTGTGERCTPAGNGPLSQAAEARYLSDARLVTTLQGQISARTEQLDGQAAGAQKVQEKQAAAALPAAEQQLSTDKNQLHIQEANFTSTNANNNGILERIRALNAAAGTDFGLQAARGLLFLFFVLIDCLPVLTKIFQNVAPAGAYERALANDEASRVEAEKQISQRRLDDETARTEARAEAHRRLEHDAADAEEQLLRDEFARRLARTRRSAARGGTQGGSVGWSWLRFPSGRARTAGPTQSRTVIQQFDPGR
jgi:hypothetical protein